MSSERDRPEGSTGHDSPIEQTVEEAEAAPPAEDLGSLAAELLRGDRNE